MTIISTYNSDSFRGYGGSIDTANIYIQNQELIPSNTSTKLEFGYNLDISKDANYIIIGCRSFSNANIGGSAYIFKKDANAYTYTEQTILISNTTAQWDFFGADVAINHDGTIAVIGAPGNTTNPVNGGQGNIYIFSRSGNTWTQDLKLSQNTYPEGSLGTSLAINYYGNYLVSYAGNSSNNTSSVFVWNQTGGNWSLQQTITSNSANANSYTFGFSLGLEKNANILIIGNPLGNNALQFGQCYAYNRSNTTWTKNQTINASQSILFQNFGSNLSLTSDANRLLIIAPEQSGDYTGNIYNFSLSNGNYIENQIFKTYPSAIDDFPFGVCMSDDANASFVGYAYGENNSSQQGGISCFNTVSNNSLYSQFQFLQSNNIANGDRFGTRLACDETGNILIASSPGANRANIANFGAVYVFVNETLI